MKKLILLFLLITSFQLSNAQVTSPNFDPVLAAKFQSGIDNAIAGGLQGASVAITFPGQGIFIGVGGESSPGVPITPDMQFNIGSNTKLFTAVLVLKLQELGKLSLDDHLSDWLPNYRYIDPNATIRQLLLHQTGFYDFWGDVPQAAFDSIVYGPDVIYTPEQVLATIGPPHFAIGEAHSYSNTNYILAGLIIEKASGKSYLQNLHEYILDPLDMDSTFFAGQEAPNGTVVDAWYFGNNLGNEQKTLVSMIWSAGAIYSTAQEMTQWFNNLFAGNIINQASLTQMLSFEPSSWYGLGIRSGYAVPEYPGYFHVGGIPGWETNIVYDPKLKFVACILTNQEEIDGLAAIAGSFGNAIFIDYPRKTNDAGITAVVSPTSETCGTSIHPEIILRNFGSSNLQTVTINYQLDGGPINTYTWSGSLQSDQTVSVSLSPITTVKGSHIFRAYTSNPNVNTEGYTYNDDASSNFYVNNGSAITIMNENFEESFPPPGWVAGTNSVFDWRKSSLSLLSGTGCAVKNNWFDASGRTYDLDLPLLNLGGMSNPVLSFNLAYGYRKDFADEFTVLVSTDCGASYQAKYTKAGNALKTADAEVLFFPSDDQWQLKTFNLSSIHGDVLIKLRATSANGNNLYIDNVRVDNVTDLCAPPTDLDALQISSFSAKLQWQFHINAGNANRFDVYYKKKGTASWSHKIVSGNKRWINVTGLQPDTDYEWYVTATCDAGNSLASPVFSFTTEAQQATITSSLKTNENIPASALQFAVFPNPTTSSTTISFSLPQSERVSIKIFDMSGRLITTIAETAFAPGQHQLKWDATNAKTGIYILKMRAGNYMETKKLVVAK